VGIFERIHHGRWSICGRRLRTYSEKRALREKARGPRSNKRLGELELSAWILISPISSAQTASRGSILSHLAAGAAEAERENPICIFRAASGVLAAEFLVTCEKDPFSPADRR